MNIKGKRVLVTGMGGFIGGRLAERLVAETGAYVRGFARIPIPQLASSIDISIGDMTDPSAANSAARGCDVIVHCAAKQLPPGSRAQFIRENVGGFENLARAGLKHGVQRFIHLSTINVHGFPPPAGCHADSPLRATGDFYTDSKIATERAAWRMRHENGLPLVVIRPACTYGPGGGAWTLTPLRRVRAGKRVLIGDGSGICNPIYVDNLIDIILLAIGNDHAVGQRFIGSDGIGVTWRDFYGSYANMLGISRLGSVPQSAVTLGAAAFELIARVTRTRPWVALHSVRFYSHYVVYDVGKSKQLLGYAPRVSFEEGMQRTWSWLLEQGLVARTGEISSSGKKS